MGKGSKRVCKRDYKGNRKMIWWIFIITLVFIMIVGAICGLIAAKRADEDFEKNYRKILDSHKG